MKICIIAHFPGNLDGSRAKGRFLYLGEMLASRGHQVELITSDFSHGAKKHFQEVSNAYQARITLLHEPGYPDNISIKRLWSHFRWGMKVGRYLNSNEKPDVVYCAIPSMTASVRAARYCKRNNVRFVIDVQDLWPEAFKISIKNKILQKAFLPITWYINQAYRNADVIVAVSDTYAKRAASVNKKNAKLLSVFLGNDGALFEEFRNSATLPKIDGALRLCYIGTLGYSYDLECVMNALSIYNKEDSMPKIQFVVMGDGPLRSEFEDYAALKDVNALFTGQLSYAEMVSNMCCCDILVNPIIKGAAQSITNKVGDYAMAGLPVINTQESKEYRQLIEEYHCGINCRVGNAQDVANALIKLVNNSILRVEMGRNGHCLGEEKFDRRKTYLDIVEAVEMG